MFINDINHPLIAHKLTLLRNKNTNSALFRELVQELVALLSYEATRNIIVHDKEINTPLAPFIGKRVRTNPSPVIIPILRAGLGMLDGMQKVLPMAEIGFLGMKRDEKTLEAYTYANRLPKDLSNRQCFLLDPMLATGHTLVASIEYLLKLGATDITSINILAAEEGIKYVSDNTPSGVDLKIFVAAVDEQLDENSYIVPGLGDAGDRLYGIVD